MLCIYAAAHATPIPQLSSLVAPFPVGQALNGFLLRTEKGRGGSSPPPTEEHDPRMFFFFPFAEDALSFFLSLCGAG